MRIDAKRTGWVVALSAVVGVACGVSSAIFLLLLDQATAFRVAHERVLYLLPVGGFLIGSIFERWGTPIKGGNNLVLDTVHDGGKRLPLRMAPMALFGTVATHFFGGSAGREGTAVQMGGSLADAIVHRTQVDAKARRQLLAAGMAGGFGSVFGTPIAGALFGMEVITIGGFEISAIAPACIASFVGDWVTRHLGVAHTHYPAMHDVDFSAALGVKLLVVALALGATAVLFIELTHGIKRFGEKWITRMPFRMALGGLVVLALWKMVGTGDYLGLGVPTIVRSFSDPSLPREAFLLKLIFTAITLGAGFLGGEVTPLFFVGAALGSTLAALLGFPIDLGASVGLAALFGAAANTPLALSVMIAEMVGVHALPYALFASVVAYVASGHRSIYPSQRIARTKSTWRRLSQTVVLRDFIAKKRSENDDRS